MKADIPEGWTDKPTEPGWYLWRESIQVQRPDLMEVKQGNGGFHFHYCGRWRASWDFPGGIWQGPLKPQEPGTVTITAAEHEELKRCKRAWGAIVRHAMAPLKGLGGKWVVLGPDGFFGLTPCDDPVSATLMAAEHLEAKDENK
jgi:hypothetical protein